MQAPKASLRVPACAHPVRLLASTAPRLPPQLRFHLREKTCAKGCVRLPAPVHAFGWRLAPARDFHRMRAIPALSSTGYRDTTALFATISTFLRGRLLLLSLSIL